MPTIAITASTQDQARRYAEAVSAWGASIHLLTPKVPAQPAEDLLAGAGGLLLTDGPPVHPARYGDAPPDASDPDPARDELEFALLREALARDMPVLAIGRGMHVLNVALGGRVVWDMPNHQAAGPEGPAASSRHLLFITPGSKLAQIVGAAGFVRVNSRHRQGLRDAHRAPALLTSAYAVDDHAVEAVESPAHSWVVGVQFRPDLKEEVPPSFQHLFLALVERAAQHAQD